MCPVKHCLSLAGPVLIPPPRNSPFHGIDFGPGAGSDVRKIYQGNAGARVQGEVGEACAIDLGQLNVGEFLHPGPAGVWTIPCLPGDNVIMVLTVTSGLIETPDWPVI